MKEMSKVFKTNTKVCSAAGPIFVHQLSLIFNDAMKVYTLYSEQLIAACAADPFATRTAHYKMMKSVKADILDMFTTYFEVSALERGAQEVACMIVQPLMETVLADFSRSPPQAREARVLKMFSTIISVLREHSAPQLPVILSGVFEPTLQMITSNMLDHPEHRIGFFKFLREANEHCFVSLFSIPPESQKMIVDSIVWAFKHTERNISEMGLEILEELLRNIAMYPQISQPFYQSFLLTLIQDVLAVMTDRQHKSGFKQQAAVLMNIFHNVQAGRVVVPLFDLASLPAGTPHTLTNADFLKEHVASLLLQSFPNLTQPQVVGFVVGLFDVTKDLNAFKQLLRDFLVAVKEFQSEDNSELYAEETAASLELTQHELREFRSSVPGLLKPDELDDDDDGAYDGRDDSEYDF